MNRIEVKDLHVSIDGKPILKGVSLKVELGKVYALMGPNGSGKSTLSQVLMGSPKYAIDKGKILLDDKDITEATPTERAKLGLFLSFQYPAEVSGVTLSNFLRVAYNAVKNEKMDVVSFHKFLKSKMEDLHMDPSFSKRYLNEGFSGGEKKRAEVLQMSVLDPKYAILDECDSGLDVNSIKIVGEGIDRMKGPKRGILLITHYSRILKYITPDVVHIMINGRIVKSGGKELAEEIEENGFNAFLKAEEV